MKKIIFLLLSFSVCSILHAQEANQYLFNRTPEMLKVEAPNAASFNKYIDNPIGLYNGTPDVNVPLYTLKDGLIEIPITLRYNTSGIKVNEEASWVGLGWNLNVGGVITRQAVGGIDRQPIRGSQTYNADKNLNTIMDIYDPDHDRKPKDFITTPWSHTMREAFDWYLRAPSMRLVQDEGRLSPDVFYFSYPGGAGKFIIDQRNDSVYIIDRKSDIKIELVMKQHSSAISITPDAKGIMHFKITLPDGITHYYDYFSNVLTPRTDAAPLSETYVLVQTKYPNGQAVHYTYDNYMHYNFTYSEQIQSGDNKTARRLDITPFPSDLQKSYGSRSLTEGIGREFVLTGISTSNYTLTFTHSNREDLPDVKKLDCINVKSYNKTIKNIRFDYTYFNNNFDYNCWSMMIRSSTLSSKRSSEHFTKRLKLLSVNTMAENQAQSDKYFFFYDNTNLPRKDSFAVDYWGYYNGEISNRSYIPKVQNLMWNNTTAYSKIINMPANNGVKFTFAERGHSSEHCTAGMLKGIRYPTGGYTDFVYESNTFIDYIIPTASQSEQNMANVKKEVKDNNSSKTPPNCKVWSYKFERDTYVTLNARVYRGGNSWESVSGHQAFVSGSTSINMNMRNQCLEMQKDWDKYHIDKGPTVSNVKKVLIKKGTAYFGVEFPDGLDDQTEYGKGGDITMDISFAVSLEDKKENEGAGVRIKELVFYDSPAKDKVLQRTGYNYTDLSTNKSSGILQKKLRYANFYPQTVDVLGTAISTQCSFPQVDKMIYSSDKFEIGSDNYLSTPYQSFSDVGYSCVKETKQTGGEKAGYTLYYFYNSEPQTAEYSISLHSPLNGEMKKVEYYGEDGKIDKSETYDYLSEISHYYYGFTYFDRLNLFPEIFNGSGWTMMEMSETNESFFYRQCGTGSVYSEMKFNHRSVEGPYLYDRLGLILYPLNSYNVFLKQKTITLDGATTKEVYSYNPQTLQLKEKRQVFPDAYELISTYTYPNDLAGSVYQEMTKKHILSPIIEEKYIKDGSLIGCKLNEYQIDKKTGFALPYKTHFSEINKILSQNTFTFNGTDVNIKVYPSDNIEFRKYDQYGNLIHSILNGAVNNVYLWGYGGQYPIAEISNATYEEVLSALGGKTPEAFSSSNNPDLLVVNSLREQLPQAHLRTYKYVPGVGMSQQSTPSGYTIYYDYDSMRRLIRIYLKEKNNDGIEKVRTLKSFNYHYYEDENI